MIFYKSLRKNLKEFKNFAEVLNKVSKKYPNRIFIIENDIELTFKTFNELVNQCCNFFLYLGLKKNDVISLYLRNSIEFVILYFASMRFGTIVNPFPVSLSLQEVIKRSKFVKSKKIFLNSNENKSKYFFFIEKKSFINNLNNFNNKFQEKCVKNEYKIASLYYSSGTTNNPKIIEYSHKSILATQYSMCIKKFSKKFSKHLCILPMGHTSSLRYSVKQCISTVSTLFIAESFWKIRSNFWKIVRKKKINFVQTVPSILYSLLQEKKKFIKTDSNSIRFIGCGSSYLSDKIKLEFQKKFNVKVSNLYGLSEVGATHYDFTRKKSKRINCIGKPFDFVKVKFLKDNKTEAKTGEAGEIIINTPGMFTSYYKNKKLYNKSFYNNYFLTGDYGFKDRHGYHYFIDRKKNIIIKGGVNIEPEEINEILKSSLMVKDVVTFGVPDVFYGEDIVSFIILKNKAINLNNLKNMCIHKIGSFKTPKEIKICKTFPAGPSGKILVRKIKEIYLK